PPAVDVLSCDPPVTPDRLRDRGDSGAARQLAEGVLVDECIEEDPGARRGGGSRRLLADIGLPCPKDTPAEVGYGDLEGLVPEVERDDVSGLVNESKQLRWPTSTDGRSGGRVS